MSLLLAQSSTVVWAGGFGAVVAVMLVSNWVIQRHFANVIVGIFDRDAPFRPRDAEPLPDVESFRIKVSNSLELTATLLCSHSSKCDSAPLVVFCPEFGASRWTARHYAAGLIDAGYAVLTFDFRNHGDSDSMSEYEPTHWLTEYEVADLEAVIDWVEASEQRRSRFVGVMGMSRGGCAALCVAAERPSVRSVFVEGVYSLRSVVLLFVDRWGRLHLPQGVLDAVPKWHIVSTVNKARREIETRRGCRFVDLEGRLADLGDRYIQFVSGARDSYVPLDVICGVLAETGHDESRLWRVKSAKHNMARDVDPDGFDRRAVNLFGQVRVHAGDG